MSEQENIEFTNGNSIHYLSNFDAVRSHRSRLMGFYCANCKEVHEDYPIKDIMFIDYIMMCKESYDKKLEPYINTEQVYCTNCFNFRLCDEGIPYCCYENKCDNTDCEDSKSIGDRPMYDRRENI